ncbi:unnamed protein product [Prorocentrum cordatum]|uniref:Uncharacterized protein n=1 Tax=Prorocentrum cordatum TaxID=2364126 RepID=A0ABN9WYL0_9DINO|nr:unnamed protein product [Polarella glacialis]
MSTKMPYCTNRCWFSGSPWLVRERLPERALAPGGIASLLHRLRGVAQTGEGAPTGAAGRHGRRRVLSSGGCMGPAIGCVGHTVLQSSGLGDSLHPSQKQARAASTPLRRRLLALAESQYAKPVWHEVYGA